jgi:hypothetical protein
MALTTRAGKGSKLNSTEMDTNILELSRILSSSNGTGIISVTGSTIQAPNTSITASYFKGDGRALTNVTASYSPAAGSNTYIQYNNNGILGAEAAFTYNATSNTLTVSNIAAGDIQVTKAINAGNGYLLDGSDITSIDWKNRTLNWPDGTSFFSWGTQDQIKITSINDAAGAADKILMLKSSTGTLFITGSSAFTTPTSSLLVTASATNNIITFTKGNGSTFNVTVNTGSGGVPSSPVNSVQFNSASVFKGDSSFAFDISTFSLAQGSNTTASGQYSHAEGYNNIASGNGSHAEGRFTTASGTFSHAEGRLTLALGQYSHAEGFGTISSGSYQTTVGQYNAHNDSTSYFIVGGGTDDSTRKDAFKVTNSSSIIVATQSAAPGWTGKEGEMVPVKNGASYFIYVYIGGAWKSASLA